MKNQLTSKFIEDLGIGHFNKEYTSDHYKKSIHFQMIFRRDFLIKEHYGIITNTIGPVNVMWGRFFTFKLLNKALRFDKFPI